MYLEVDRQCTYLLSEVYLNIIKRPSVFLIAETRVRSSGIIDWLESIGVNKVKSNEYLNNARSDSEVIVELAARRCYKSFDVGLNPNVDKIRTDSREYFANILQSGHGSVLEHASCTFAIENVSRVVTHELVRHRAGMGFSQESMRYVRLDELNVVIPVDNNSEDVLPEELVTKVVEFIEKEINGFQSNEFTPGMPFKKKKELTSAIRRLIPHGISTGIVVTGNMRAWRNVIEQRGNKHAEVEIQQVAEMLFDILSVKYPLIFQDFFIEDGDIKSKNKKV